MSRHSIANTIRQVRGATGSASLAALRYGSDELTEADIIKAMKLLNAVERLLLSARRRVAQSTAVKRRRAA